MKKLERQTLLSIFKKNGNEEFYYRPNAGNGGDALIAAGTIQFFKDNKLNYKIYSKDMDLSNKVVVYGGGGNFVDGYGNCGSFIRDWHSKAKMLILLPHTISGNKEILKSLGSNVYLFAREQVSYDYLRSLDLQANIFIDDDMALNFVPKMNFFEINHAKKYFILRFVKKILKGDFKIFTLNAFRTDSEKTSISVPEDNIDVSDAFNSDYTMLNEKKILYSAQNFVEFVSYHRVVNTNRLHVSIEGHLMGKKVNFSSNSFWKNEAVYNKSLIQNSKINFTKVS